MSVIAWLDRDGVALRTTPTFSVERGRRNMPQLENETLLAKLKTGCCVREFSDYLHRCYPDARDYPIFKLDVLLCLRELELAFGAVASPLGSVRLVGLLRRNPLQRRPLNTEARYVLSRFAYQHRVEGEWLLDCPLSDVQCVIASDLLARVLFCCGREAQSVSTLLELAQDEVEHAGLVELLGVLARQGVLIAVGEKQQVYRRADEPQAQQGQWDFHNLLFHVESSRGYNTAVDAGHAFGAGFPYRDRFPELPAEHPPFAGDKLALPAASEEQHRGLSFTDVLQQRKSIREYDIAKPITITELGAFLDLCMRGKAESRVVDWYGFTKVTVAKPRAYPSGGALYEQEIYLAVLSGDGLARGFYHYDPFSHALTRISSAQDGWQFHIECRFAQWPPTSQPDILFMFAARYHRVTWKYSRMSYAIVLKNVGCLYQTMYLVATFMGLAACGQGGGNHRAFAELSGQDPWHEGIAGEFMLGRPAARRN